MTMERPVEEQPLLEGLRATGAERDHAIAELHALLLRAARFEVGRRRAALLYQFRPTFLR